MLKEYKENLKIRLVERLKNSVYGNPRYALIVENENGDILRGKTASNAMIGYELGWTSEGKTYKIAYHYTSNNNLIFDRIIND